MALYTRFGDRVELLRLATLDDVKTYEHRKVDKIDRDRTKNGWRGIARYLGGPGLGSKSPGDENVGKEILVDAALLRADDGWSEISKAFEALQVSS